MPKLIKDLPPQPKDGEFVNPQANDGVRWGQLFGRKPICPHCKQELCWHCWTCGADVRTEEHRPGCETNKVKTRCVACEGTGMSSRGNACEPCRGTGVAKCQS